MKERLKGVYRMKFSKMHGLGNDFIVLEGEKLAEAALPELAKRLCDRHTGIGADGILLLLPSEKADLRMRILNCDGSEAEMCGNGIRCFARYAYEQGRIAKTEFTVETLAGIIRPRLTVQAGKVAAITIDMGRPLWKRSEIPMLGAEGEVIGEEIALGDQRYAVTSLVVGVPHTIVFTEDVKTAPVLTVGPQLEKHPVFPKGTNINFVEVKNRREIYVRTWERGAGATLACGTGCCASVAASWRNGHTERAVTVHLALGDLEIVYHEDGKLYMTGPAEYAFAGDFTE